MLRIVEIIEVVPYSITCKFNTGEVKKIALESYIAESNNMVDKDKLLSADFFTQAQIGRKGGLYWKNAAFMRDEKARLIPCEFDISPEFVYYNATCVQPELI